MAAGRCDQQRLITCDGLQGTPRLLAIVAINKSRWVARNQTFTLNGAKGALSKVTPWLTSAGASLAPQTPVPVASGATITYAIPPRAWSRFRVRLTSQNNAYRLHRDQESCPDSLTGPRGVLSHRRARRRVEACSRRQRQHGRNEVLVASYTSQLPLTRCRAQARKEFGIKHRTAIAGRRPCRVCR